MATCTVMSGNTYQKLKHYCKYMNMGYVTSSAFYQLQGLYILPAIEEEFDMMRQELLDQYKDVPLVLCGKHVLVVIATEYKINFKVFSL